LLGRVLTAAALFLVATGVGFGASAETRSLKLYNAHTRESATIVYKRDGRFDQAGLTQLNRFMRDWRQNKPTKMDPKLYDVLWEVYRKSGATRPITVICGYRAPETNAQLRRRSSGVAENSLHTKGMAIDYFIPGVPLAKLRALGLQAQAGGVGYYPKSGSPFVHMDTGSVRHWPRMSRSELVAVFPKGGTLHTGTDGKPLPGYSEALAAYKARQARGILVSWATGNGDPTPFVPEVQVAGSAEETFEIAAADMPLPRLAPDRDGDGEVAEGQDGVAAAIAIAQNDPALRSTEAPLLSYPVQVDRVIGRDRFEDFDYDAIAAEIDFDEAMSAPPVPTELADAMSARDTTVRPDAASTSVPIQPTAIVSTVDIGVDLSRTLRADAITAAVFRETDAGQPPVLAYAAATAAAPQVEPAAPVAAAPDLSGVPQPQPNPLRDTVAALDEPTAAVPAEEMSADQVYSRLPAATLTLTKLDTQGLRIWIGERSTREKPYAVFTMPAFAEAPDLLDKPEVIDAMMERGPAAVDRQAHARLRRR
jgi:uncharacterized protein YcbK (DUF882 family)